MADPQRQAAGVTGCGFGPHLIQRQPQRRGEAAASGDHVGGLHPVGQVDHGQVAGAVAVDLGREADRVRILGDGGVDADSCTDSSARRTSSAVSLRYALPSRHPVGDRLVRRPTRPRRGGTASTASASSRHRARPRQDGSTASDAARAKHRDQDRPAPARTDADGGHRASARRRRRRGRRRPDAGASCLPPRWPSATAGRPAYQRTGHREHGGLGRVLRDPDRVIGEDVASISAQVPHRRAQTTPRPRPIGQDRPPLLLADQHLSRDLLGHINRAANPARSVIHRLGILDTVPDIDTIVIRLDRAET